MQLDESAAGQAGIVVGVAAPADIAETVDLPGEVRLNGERVSELRPRFRSLVRDMRKRLGDSVKTGEVVAILESNESLGEYELRTGPGGTVIAVGAVPGQSVGEETILYKVADLSSVWVDAAVYPPQMALVRRGLRARIAAESAPALMANGTISYVGPVEGEGTRTSLARVVLPNPDRRWQPGLFVTVRVTVSRSRVPVAVPEDAVVRTAQGPAVFLANGASYRLQPVTAGRSDGSKTEILAGLEPGARIVVRNAFRLKAELGRSEVETDD